MNADYLELPIYAKEREIIESIRNNPVTLIVAETGSGKSTQVPKMILDQGWRCMVTQPRRMAAISIAHRVIEELGQEMGEDVGYGVRGDIQFNKNTDVVFCTDGLGLVRELLMETGDHILIIDEVHEMNLNMEALLAWSKYQISKDPQFRLVLMSATVDTYEFMEYFEGDICLIEASGRTYPVEDLTERYLLVTIENTLQDLLKKGHHVLVFQPGKGEISKFISDIQNRDDETQEFWKKVQFIPLHGELSWELQKRCFEQHAGPTVIVATNVAQSSITPNVTAVISTGQCKQINVVDGVQGLYLEQVSEADITQQKGRAGRMSPGVFVDKSRNFERPQKTVPEINRVHIDKFYLQILMAGLDPESLDFLHQPKKESLCLARKLLLEMECIDKDRNVTDLGKTLVRYPLDVRYAKMMHSAKLLGVSDAVLSVVSYLSNQIRLKMLPFGMSTKIQSDLCLAVFYKDVADAIVESVDKTNYPIYGYSPKARYKYDFTNKQCKLSKHMEMDNSFIPKEGSISEKWRIIKDRVTLAVLSGMTDRFFYDRYSIRSFIGCDREVSNTGSAIRGRKLNVHSFTFGVGMFAAGIPVDIPTKFGTLGILSFLIPIDFTVASWFPKHFTITTDVSGEISYLGGCVCVKKAIVFKNSQNTEILDKKNIRLHLITRSDERVFADFLDSMEDCVAEYGVSEEAILAKYRELAQELPAPVYDPETQEVINDRAMRAKEENDKWNNLDDQEKMEIIQSVQNVLKDRKPVNAVSNTTNWSLVDGRVTCPNGHSFKAKSRGMYYICPMCSSCILSDKLK